MSEGNGTEGAGGPGWITRGIQSKMEWRDGDIAISVPPKSGTTWTMNIVYQLLSGGSDDFRDVYEEVPWIEFLNHPDRTIDEAVAKLDAMPTGKRRAFKTHSAPPTLPFFEEGEGPAVKYIVVARNPEEALVSFRPFLGQHSDGWYALWGVPPGMMTRPDFPTFYREVVEAMGLNAGIFHFLNAWWPLRERANVLMLHYADMVRDHEGSIRKIADFLDIALDDDQWARVLEYTSFDWMKAHEDKFEFTTAGETPILKRGAMMRKGRAGAAAEDGMSEEISRELRAIGEDVCPHEGAVEWFYAGQTA